MEVKSVKPEASWVSSKGQVVIPARLRRRLGIRKGTMVSFREEDSCLILQPITPKYLRSLRGILKGRPDAMEFLLRERRRQREKYP